MNNEVNKEDIAGDYVEELDGSIDVDFEEMEEIDNDNNDEDDSNKKPSKFKGVIEGYSDIVKITLTIAGLAL